MNHICFSMALSNLKNNKRHYRAYLSINAMIVMFIYLFIYIANNDGLSKISGGNTIKLLLFMGMFAVGIFSAIFQFYINSFLMKRRKKEYGLYSILGLEKKHISRIMLFENVILFLTSSVIGTTAGILSGKVMFKLLLKLMKCEVPFKNDIKPINIGITCLMFLVVNIVVYLYNVRTIYKTSTIDMLKGGQKATETTKKESVLRFIAGIGMVAFACIQLNRNVAVFGSIENLFVNVVILLLGTYLVYEAVCYFILKALTKVNKVYYKKNNFFPISNMLYRNKQTATGLASICIILTVISIITSTTVSLYAGTEQQVKDALAYDGLAIFEKIEGDEEILEEAAEEAAESSGAKLMNSVIYHPLIYTVYCDDNSNMEFNNSGSKDLCLLNIFTQNDYNRIQGDSISLAENEAAIVSEHNIYRDKESITLGNTELEVVSYLKSFKLIEQQKKTSSLDDIYVIVANEAVQNSLMEDINTAYERRSTVETYYEFGSSGSEEERLAFENTLRSNLDNSPISIDEFTTKHEIRDNSYAQNSVYLFLGFFLAILFLSLMLVIMYHKQLQEAVDDTPKYGIMRKIGCSAAQCKKIIRNQSCIAYFAPVVLAGVYSAVMYKVICGVLKIFLLGDTGIIIKCILATFATVFVIYLIGYLITNRVYAKTVLEKK